MFTIILFSAIVASCAIFSSPEKDTTFEDIEKNNSK